MRDTPLPKLDGFQHKHVIALTHIEKDLPRRPFHRVQDKEAEDIDEVGIRDGRVEAVEVVHPADGGRAMRAVHVVEEELAQQEVSVVIPLPVVGAKVGRGAQDAGHGGETKASEEHEIDRGRGEEREFNIESVCDDGVPVPSLV